MKAEHRKELQTNSLADLLGRTVRNVRGGTGVSWTKIIIVGVVVAGLLGVWWWWTNKTRTNIELWAKLENNTQKQLAELHKENKDTKQGKAATLTLAFDFLVEGVRSLGGGPEQMKRGIEYLSVSRQLYSAVLEDCKDEPEWEAEAKYGIAVAKECYAVADTKFLDEAKKDYEELSKGSLAKTAFGVLAARRFEQLNNPNDSAAVSKFYTEFKARSMGGARAQ